MVLERGSELVVALTANDNAFGTAITLATTGGLKVESSNIGPPQLDWEQNEDLCGSAIRQPDISGGQQSVEGSIVYKLRYDGSGHLPIAAGLGVAGTPSQLTDEAYSNTYTHTDEISKNFTLHQKKLIDATNCTNGIWENPSTFAEGFTISIGPKMWKVDVALVADQLDLESTKTTSMSAVTTTSAPIILFKDTIIRINDKTDSALAVGDIVKATSLELAYTGALAKDHASGSGFILVPARDGFADWVITMTFPRLSDYQTLADFLAETEKKMDIIATGAQILATGETYLFKIEIPRIQFDRPEQPNPDAGLVRPVFTGKIFDSDALATGMTTIAGPLKMTVQNQQTATITP